MNPLRWLRDRFARGDSVGQEIVGQDKDQFVGPVNRAERRAVAVWMRKRGAGWTRPYRKGRTKRHGEETT